MGGMGDTVAMLGDMAAGADRVTESFIKLGDTATKTGQTITQNAEKINKSMEETHKHVATKLDDLIYKLKQASSNGDAIAKSVLNVVEGVKNGIIPTLDAVHAFGDAMATIDGRTRSVRDLLSDVLPQMGDVLKNIDDTVDHMKTYGEGVELLRETNNGLAESFASLVEAYEKGEVTLDEVLKAAEQIKRTIPGSVPDRIAQGLVHGLQTGQF